MLAMQNADSRGGVWMAAIYNFLPKTPMEFRWTGHTSGSTVDLLIVYNKFPDGDKFSLIMFRLKHLQYLLDVVTVPEESSQYPHI